MAHIDDRKESGTTREHESVKADGPREDGDADTTEPCIMLEWDSRFFGRRIARVEGDRLNWERVQDVKRWCSENEVDCLYFLCRADDDVTVAAAEENGFHLVDIRVELNWRVQQVERIPAAAVRQFHEEDLSELRRIASRIYTDTRFYYDTHFSRLQVAQLYSEWITKSCHDPAERVLVISSEERPRGFITCTLDGEGVGHIGLLGIDDNSQGKGYGQALIAAAQTYFEARGVKEVRVITQGRNIAAQRLYQSRGFRTCDVGLWYHKWFI